MSEKATLLNMFLADKLKLQDELLKLIKDFE